MFFFLHNIKMVVKFITERRQQRVDRKRLNGCYKPNSSAKQEECNMCNCHGEVSQSCDECMNGEGIVSYLTDKFSKFNVALKGRPKLINDLMETTKNIPVVGISVIRQPITPIFETILNKLTFGKLKNKMNELGYDKLFHLYLKFDLANGAFYMMEKNQRLMVRNSMPNKDAEFSPTTIMNDGKDIKSYIETMESKNIPNLYLQCF